MLIWRFQRTIIIDRHMLSQKGAGANGKATFITCKHIIWESYSSGGLRGYQFPKLVNAATSQLLAKADREDLTEAVRYGVAGMLNWTRLG